MATDTDLRADDTWVIDSTPVKFGLTLDGVHQAAARVAATAGAIHPLSLFVPGDDAALREFEADTLGQLEGAARSEAPPSNGSSKQTWSNTDAPHGAWRRGARRVQEA